MYEQYGFEAPHAGLATSADDAARLAGDIGFPVALKVASPDILHKTEIGGVILSVRTPDEVRQGFDRIMSAAQAAHPGARIEGIQVQEMVTGGVEVIIGLLDDPQFGPVIMFGLGGVLTEVLKDVSFRVLPIEPLRSAADDPGAQGPHDPQGLSRPGARFGRHARGLADERQPHGDGARGRAGSRRSQPRRRLERSAPCPRPKVIWRTDPKPTPAFVPARTDHLATFFKGQAVAVVGASATPGKVGYCVLDSLVNYDFAGRVYPINPGHAEILGAKCYPTLSAVPEPLDVVVVAVALAAVPKLIAECAALGIRNMVILSGGGKELGGDMVDLERQIREMAIAHDVRVVGPNCIGVFDGHSRMDTFFQVQERLLRPVAGRIAMITQSGTVGCIFLEQAAALGMSKFVSYGNRIDVDEADLLAYLADDPETDIIAMYVEGLEKGRRLLETAKLVTQKKPVVVLKVGRTERGARASMSHTGFFGGSYGVVQGAFRQAGMIPVDSMEELMAVCKALAMQPCARGNRVSMISNGAARWCKGSTCSSRMGWRCPS